MLVSLLFLAHVILNSPDYGLLHSIVRVPGRFLRRHANDLLSNIGRRSASLATGKQPDREQPRY